VSITLTACFDSADTADLALARLRGSGMLLNTVRTHTRSDAPYGTGILFAPYGLHDFAPLDESRSSLSGANMQTFGGFVWGAEDLVMAAPACEMVWNEPSRPAQTESLARGETILSFSLPASQAKQAESILIGCHAHRIRTTG